MNESVLDVLKYLLEHHAGGTDVVGPGQDSLRAELTQVGFPEVAVEKAFSWLETLAAPAAVATLPARLAAAPYRLFAPDEQDRLDVRSRGYLLALEHAGVLDAVQREVVIDRVMALDDAEVDLEQLRWVVRMVLDMGPSRYAPGGPVGRFALDKAAGHLH